MKNINDRESVVQAYVAVKGSRSATHVSLVGRRLLTVRIVVRIAARVEYGEERSGERHTDIEKGKQRKRARDRDAPVDT